MQCNYHLQLISWYTIVIFLYFVVWFPLHIYNLCLAHLYQVTFIAIKQFASKIEGKCLLLYGIYSANILINYNFYSVSISHELYEYDNFHIHKTIIKCNIIAVDRPSINKPQLMIHGVLVSGNYRVQVSKYFRMT